MEYWVPSGPVAITVAAGDSDGLEYCFLRAAGMVDWLRIVIFCDGSGALVLVFLLL